MKSSDNKLTIKNLIFKSGKDEDGKIARQLFKEKVFSVLTDEPVMKRLQNRAIYSVFTAVALFMSIVNIITGRSTLLIATAAFSGLCAADLALSFLGKKGEFVAVNLFMVEIIALFSFFIVTGGTDNFSIIWLLMLPTIGLFFFGMELGSILCLIVFLIMVCCFHVPALRLICTDYGETFRLRFPFVFCACYIVSCILELVRATTQKALEELRGRYMDMYTHDMLTGFENRYGLDNFAKVILPRQPESFGVIMADIDHFKDVNDTYGHQRGDVVLRELASRINLSIPDSAHCFRWGGEEFIILCEDGESCEQVACKIWKAARSRCIELSEDVSIDVTVSVGCTSGRLLSRDDLEQLIRRADDNMYKAKVEGRDRVVSEKSGCICIDKPGCSKQCSMSTSDENDTACQPSLSASEITSAEG